MRKFPKKVSYLLSPMNPYTDQSPVSRPPSPVPGTHRIKDDRMENYSAYIVYSAQHIVVFFIIIK